MIRSFADNRTNKVFNGIYEQSFPALLIKRARRKLDRINYATSISDLRLPPGNRLEKLSGDHKGQYSIRISKGWRICFHWKDGDAFEVELNNHYG